MQVAAVLIACVLAAMTASFGLGLGACESPSLRVPPSVVFPLNQVPLCVVVGLLCGLASVFMANATIHASRCFRMLRGAKLPAAALPPLGGLVTGMLALLCPLITYTVCCFSFCCMCYRSDL